jgi:cytochrome P450
MYGYTIDPQNADPLIALIERMMHNFSFAILPLHWAVDFLPVIKYLPKTLPGMSFKKTAARCNEINRMVTDIPYAFVRQQMEDGSHEQSFVASIIEGSGHDDQGTNKMTDEDENAIKSAAAALYGGGSDTTVSSISSFILAMILFPSVQKKAQQELDLVLGADRLPQFEDRDNLPYVNAVVKESLRWLPVAPLGLTHTTDEELLYRTFHIPKGAYLVPAIWWFLHDPGTYSNPSLFDPDRYLEPRNEPDPATEAFGYGRRKCPGRLLADESLFMTISRLLTVFNITKAVDDHGQCIEPKLDVTPGVISRPVSFPYSIRPRNEHSAVMIRSVEVEHPWKKGDADLLAGLD